MPSSPMHLSQRTPQPSTDSTHAAHSAEGFPAHTARQSPPPGTPQAAPHAPAQAHWTTVRYMAWEVTQRVSSVAAPLIASLQRGHACGGLPSSGAPPSTALPPLPPVPPVVAVPVAADV